MNSYIPEGAIEVELSEAEHQKKLYEALKRLQKNPDFRLLVSSDYLKDYALKLVMSLHDPMQFSGSTPPQVTAEINSKLSGIAHFKEYLYFIADFGQSAEEALDSMQERELLEKEEEEEEGMQFTTTVGSSS